MARRSSSSSASLREFDVSSSALTTCAGESSKNTFTNRSSARCRAAARPPVDRIAGAQREKRAGLEGFARDVDAAGQDV